MTPTTTACATSRVVQAVNAAGAPGTQIVVPLTVAAQGDENAFGYSVPFDTTALTYLSATLAADFPQGSSLIPTETQVASGRLGVLEARGRS